MSDIVWEDPPPKSLGVANQPQWPARLAPLREHPGKWARIRDYKNRNAASTSANYLRKRAIGFDPTEFEFTCRTEADGTGVLYARYIGGES
jgi:hypothetical protein